MSLLHQTSVYNSDKLFQSSSYKEGTKTLESTLG